MVATGSGERRAGPIQGVVLLLPATLAVMAVLVLAPDLPQLFRTFGRVPGAAWLVPMVLTLPALCMIVFGPFAGWCGDRYGRRPLLIGSLLVYAVLGLAPFVLDDLKAILVSRIGVGVAEAFALTLSTTLIGDTFDGPARDRWLGYQTAVASVSAIVFVAAGGALGALGWRGPFAIYAAPIVFAGLVAALTWQPAPRPHEVDAPAVRFPWRVMGAIFAVTFAASVLFYIAQIQSSVALDAKGLKNPAAIGGLIALVTLATVLGTAAFRFAVTWPTARLLTLGFGCVGLGYLGVGYAPSAAWITAALALAQFGCGVLLPSMLTCAMRNLPYAMRGRGMGAWQGVFSIGQFFSPLVMTLIGRSLGFGLFGAFLAMGAFSLVAAAVAAVAWTRSRPIPAAA